MIPSSTRAFQDSHSGDEETPPPLSPAQRRLTLQVIAGLVLLPLLLASLWPVTFDSREELFEIPKGTWARRMAGDKREYLPSKIFLLLGVRNVLKLKNSDDVPQFFGPTLLMPGQTLTIPFSRASENSFACTAHSSGQLLVIVEPNPVWPWDRLRWRLQRLLRDKTPPRPSRAC